MSWMQRSIWAAVFTAGTGAALGADFVTAEGRQFVLNGQPLRFVGYNLRGACHYGDPAAVPGSTTADLAYNLDFCESTKARVIRVFCPHKSLDPVATGHRLGQLLDACAARGVWVIVCLIDVYHATGMCPKSDYGYYTYQGCCGLWLLGHEWYESGYHNNYLPQVRYLAQRFRDHPAIFAWQLGNEIRDIGHGATFLAFCHDVAAEIRAIDRNHMISIGLINAWHAETDALTLYQPFDFVGTHNYNGGGDDNSWIAATLDKPYIIDEAGFDSGVFGPDRTPESSADMTKWFTQNGAVGYMNWALMATPYSNGDGDHMFGIDRVLNGHSADYEKYRALYASWGNQFVSPSTLAVSPGEITREIFIGESLAPETLIISGAGYTPFGFTISETASWLSVSPAEGQATPAGTPIELTYDTAGLPEGTYEATVRLNATFISNSPLDVRITLKVHQKRGDFDDDGDMDLEDYGRFQVCLSGGNIPHAGGACVGADYDNDGDVDSADVNHFIACMSGPNQPADPACLK